VYIAPSTVSPVGFQDKTKERNGLGLIGGDKDNNVFEIHCLKKKVFRESDEGMDLEISALNEEDVSC